MEMSDRWKGCFPDPGLTWGVFCDGVGPVDALDRWGAFKPANALAEIGPGYGRVLAEILYQRKDFQHYTGIDTSAANVAFLSRYQSPKVSLVNSDVREWKTYDRFSVVYSFLCMKHISPDFASVAAGVAKLLAPGGMFIFDLIEGEHPPVYGSSDCGVWFARYYTRPQVLAALPGWTVAFDTVTHRKGFDRMLVAAMPPKS